MRLSNKALRNHLAELRDSPGDEIVAVVSHLTENNHVCCESTIALIVDAPAAMRELLAARKVVAAAKAFMNVPSHKSFEAAEERLNKALDAYTRQTRGE